MEKVSNYKVVNIGSGETFDGTIDEYGYVYTQAQLREDGQPKLSALPIGRIKRPNIPLALHHFAALDEAREAKAAPIRETITLLYGPIHDAEQSLAALYETSNKP